jgi:N6-adenosine-specific RNA methylase IME4
MININNSIGNNNKNFNNAYVRNVRIEDIAIKNGRRNPSDKKVQELADSIRDIGLINPITITEDYTLIAGLHRLKAFQLLEREYVPAMVMLYDTDSDISEQQFSLACELAEIDENLIRNELHFTERGDELLKRKRVYELLYPDTKKGAVNQYTKEVLKETVSVSKPTFTEDTARKVGVTARTIRHEIQISEKLQPEIKQAVKDLDISKTEALELARLDNTQQKNIIAKKQAMPDISIKEAAREIRKDEKKQEREMHIEAIREKIKAEPLIVPSSFDVVVLDPPWPYGREYDPESSRVANPYPEMTIEQIAAIKVPANDNAILWLWTTHKFLPYAYDLLDTWGFDYKATLVWNKERIGMGAWLRMQCEFCLMAIKGKPTYSNTIYRDIITEPRREHSRKPDSFYDMVDNICPGNKLDYFSREKRNNWFSLGVESDKFI